MFVSARVCVCVFRRTYDVSIVYDKYYQTPRVYLFGYDENREPLKPVAIWQDISGEHANETVTVESHPHIPNMPHISIHPCKVSQFMLVHMNSLQCWAHWLMLTFHPVSVSIFVSLFEFLVNVFSMLL
jgi:Autophagocytosis associated protein, active-site domain